MELFKEDGTCIEICRLRDHESKTIGLKFRYPDREEKRVVFPKGHECQADLIFDIMKNTSYIPDCHAGSDGECNWKICPQLRDGEPDKTGRHCPLDKGIYEDY